jgi:hypothetical protein
MKIEIQNHDSGLLLIKVYGEHQNLILRHYYHGLHSQPSDTY